MGGARRMAAVCALMTGLVTAIVCTPSQAATHAAAPCLLGCATTTTTITTTTASPASVGQITVTSLSSTEAALAATVNPGAGSIPYGWQLMTDNTVAQRSDTLVTPESASTLTYRFTGLTPNTDYTVLISYSDGADGNATMYSQATRFHTPILPAAVPHLGVSGRVIHIGTGVTLTASADRNPTASLLLLEDAVAPTRHFTPDITSATGPSGTQSLLPRMRASDTVYPDRNTRFRFSLPGTLMTIHGHRVQRPSVSGSVLVYVLPVGSVVVSRPNNGLTVDAELEVTVRALIAGFRGEDVYFYNATTAKGAGRLIGHAPLRRTGITEFGASHLNAHVDFRDDKGSYIRACTRHAIVTDMGTPFTDRACGRATLAYGA